MEKILKSPLTTEKKKKDVLQFLTSLKFTNPRKGINLKTHSKTESKNSSVQNSICFINVTIVRTLINVILILSLNHNLLRQLSQTTAPVQKVQQSST